MNYSQVSQETNNPRTIVLGITHHPRTVGAIQSLGRAGVHVIGMDHEAPTHRGYSRYLKERFSIEAEPQKVVNFLESIGSGGGVLMPGTDHYLILLAKHFERLSRYFIMTTPHWEALEKVMEFSECYSMARRIGLKTPNFFKPRDEQEMREIVENLDLDNHSYLLKTMPGTERADLRNGRYTKVAGSSRALIRENCLEIFSRLGQFPTIVEVVPGEADRCIGVSMVVDRDHRPVVSYCVKRLKLYIYSKHYARSNGELTHPYELGANVYCESIRDHEAVEAAARFVQAAKYYGVITLEFRRSPTDECLTLIKCDPRFVRATSLSRALGLDVTTTLYRVFTNNAVQATPVYREGIAWIWLSEYLEALWNNWNNLPVRKELFGLFTKFHRIKAVAFLDIRDPLPFIMDCVRAGRIWVQRADRSISRCISRIRQLAAHYIPHRMQSPRL